MSLDSTKLAEENAALQAKILKLKKINASLMKQVEKSTDATGESMVLFQNAIELERKVNERTQILETVKKDLERSNQELLASNVIAEEATKAKSQFLATMSHEIRTPMNGLVGVLHLLEDGLPQDKVKLLDTARRCADDLLLLINDILDFSKIEAGKMQLESVRFNALELVESICELHATAAHSKGLELISNCRPGYKFDAVGDPLRIRQIVSNLLSNAIKFTESGEISLAVRMLPGSAGNDRLRIEVNDTGIGMKPEAQARLFNAFSQANSSTTRKYGGSGLGLSICKKLIELMGGSIGASSEEGLGSRFWFEIPQSKIERCDREDPARKIVNGKLALVVDTSEAARTNLEAWLVEWGCKLFATSSLKSALDFARSSETKIDYLFIDKKRVDSHAQFWNDAQQTEPALADATTIVLTRISKDQRAGQIAPDQQELRKPISIARLSEILSGVSRRHAESETPIKLETESGPLRILLVDDNITNRMIASQFLQQKHSLTPVTANNGREAIQAMQSHDFDLVLMDCMMPEMDGYDASRAIREGQGGRNHREVPIIALTANAMHGDRETCIAAGMSDYLAKPIHPKDLAKVLAKWAGKRHERIHGDDADAKEAESPEAVEFSSLTVFDPKILLEMYEGDEAVVANLLKFFLESLEATMGELRDAIDDVENLDQIRFFSHQVKGSAANFGACQLATITGEMEARCLQGDAAAAIKLYPQARAASALVARAISEHRGTLKA